MDTTAPNFQTIEDAAERYKVNPRTIRRLIEAKKITVYKIGSKIIRIDVNETDALFREVA